MTRALSEIDRGAFVDPSRSTLSQFLDRWTRDFAASHHSPKTLERENQLLQHVKREIGATRLQKLRPVDFAQLYAKLQRGGGDGAARALAARTVAHLHRIMHRALGHAVSSGLLSINPVGGGKVDAPRAESQELAILAEQQARDIMARLRGKSLGPIIVLALATGMRRGELLALRWRDIDLDGGKVRVEQAVEETKAGLRFKAPKTKHGRRSIAVPASIVTGLRVHWKAQQVQRLKLGLGKSPDDSLVFPNWDGTPRSPRGVSRAWREAARDAGLPAVTFHALRHTHASQLIAAGMDVLTISRRLGHGSPTVTLGVYGHLFANTDDRAAAIIEAAFAATLTE